MVYWGEAREGSGHIGVGTISPRDAVTTILKRYKRRRQRGGFVRIKKIQRRRRLRNAGDVDVSTFQSKAQNRI